MNCVVATRCFNGRMTQRLECVPPDALLIVGGRSDTYGVLSSVELVTNLVKNTTKQGCSYGGGKLSATPNNLKLSGPGWLKNT
jgi:hypothetical protein